MFRQITDKNTALVGDRGSISPRTAMQIFDEAAPPGPTTPYWIAYLSVRNKAAAASREIPLDGLRELFFLVVGQNSSLRPLGYEALSRCPTRSRG